MKTKMIASSKSFFKIRMVSCFIVATMLFAISFLFMEDRWLIFITRTIGLVFSYKYANYFFTRIYFPISETKTRKKPTGALNIFKYYFCLIFIIIWLSSCIALMIKSLFYHHFGFGYKIFFMILCYSLIFSFFATIFTYALNANYKGDKPVVW